MLCAFGTLCLGAPLKECPDFRRHGVDRCLLRLVPARVARGGLDERVDPVLESQLPRVSLSRQKSLSQLEWQGSVCATLSIFDYHFVPFNLRCQSPLRQNRVSHVHHLRVHRVREVGTKSVNSFRKLDL